MSGLYLYCGVFNMTILICDTILKKFEHSKISLSLFFFSSAKIECKVSALSAQRFSRKSKKTVFLYEQHILFANFE